MFKSMDAQSQFFIVLYMVVLFVIFSKFCWPSSSMLSKHIIINNLKIELSLKN